MTEITKEQAAQLESDLVYMSKAGLSQEDKDAYVDERLRGWGVSMPATEIPPSKVAGILSLAGPIVGGIAGSGLGARIAASPALATKIGMIKSGAGRFLARRAVETAQPLMEAGGIAAGDIAGRAVAGQEQNVPASLGMGGVGAGTGVLFRAATRGAGAIGNVPRVAVDEAGIPTAGIFPSYQKVVRPSPRTVGEARAGVSAEAKLADRAAEAVSKMESTITKPRLEKAAILRDLETQGATVDPMPVVDQLLKEIPKLRMEPTTAGPFTKYLEEFAENIVDEAAKRGGAFKPLEWDEFIRTNLAPKAFTDRGTEVTSRYGPIIRRIKQIAAEQLRNLMPPEKRGLDKKISDLLDQAEEASGYFAGDRSGVIGRIRTIRNPGNEERIQALNFLSKQGGDPALFKDTMRTGTQRMFTTDIRESFQPAGGMFGTVVKTPLEFASQAMAPLQPVAGPASAPFTSPIVGPFIANQTRELLDWLGRAMTERAAKRTPPPTP